MLEYMWSVLLHVGRDGELNFVYAVKKLVKYYDSQRLLLFVSCANMTASLLDLEFTFGTNSEEDKAKILDFLIQCFTTAEPIGLLWQSRVSAQLRTSHKHMRKSLKNRQEVSTLFSRETAQILWGCSLHIQRETDLTGMGCIGWIELYDILFLGGVSLTSLTLPEEYYPLCPVSWSHRCNLRNQDITPLISDYQT